LLLLHNASAYARNGGGKPEQTVIDQLLPFVEPYAVPGYRAEEALRQQQLNYLSERRNWPGNISMPEAIKKAHPIDQMSFQIFCVDISKL
jgi:hypothetical protein